MSHSRKVENPYAPPQAEQHPQQPRGSKIDLIIARTAIWLYRAPLLAMILMLVFMTSAFGWLAEDGSTDPAKLAEKISKVLLMRSVGLGLGLIGWVLALVSLFRPYLGQRSNYWSWIILSAVYSFFGFPVGTICGLFLIGLVMKKRREFGKGRARELDVSEVD